MLNDILVRSLHVEVCVEELLKYYSPIKSYIEINLLISRHIIILYYKYIMTRDQELCEIYIFIIVYRIDKIKYIFLIVMTRLL